MPVSTQRHYTFLIGNWNVVFRCSKVRESSVLDFET